MKPDITAILAEEADDPMAWWWLSFCDGDRPKGDQFLGACVVSARGPVSAVSKAHRLGINPGGEVAILGPAPLSLKMPEGCENRLMARAEAEAFEWLP